MLTYIGTLLLLLLVSIIVVRFMGKTALSQFTPHDLAAIFFIIAIAMNAVEVEGILQSLVGIGIVISVHITLSKLSLYNRLNRFVIGEPTILIKHGKLIRSNLKKSRFSLAELLSSIRSKGIADITTIQYAILEPDGGISVLPKEEVLPVTTKMAGYDPDYQGFSISVIIEGEIQHRNLALIHKDEQWLLQEIKAAGFTKLNHVFYASVNDTNHSLVVDNGKGFLGSV
ncbi:DUF421 domain-containing protein [Salibacterium salarium]|uniref:DUF421 domain-containing protein n=1 Tax=Salibacterium salarium TaxID=284579 RepID=A0A3R9Q226_9BACI|nr:DUF421 domain-containing protein [Salibacterium salarium]RSL31940.1 DUF421 domain-containing protein [Salibacterium salarium]